MKVIITGATGMVGEGVLLECLQNKLVSDVLSISRKTCNITHPKLKELLVSDFTKLNDFEKAISGYDACFFCAGISSVGMNEEKYTYITYTTTLEFAKAVLKVNPGMAFCYVSGQSTDSTEKGKLMWARVKGKTENDLMKMSFSKVYNFRPGVMLPYPGQKNWKTLYQIIAKIMQVFSPSSILTLSEVGKAMINVVLKKESSKILEIAQIRSLAKES